MTGPISVFDRRLLRRRRDRAAAGLDDVDFLFREAAERLADRLDDVTRRFPVALDLGCHTGLLGAALGGRGGIETLVSCDLSAAMAARAPGPRLVADEEALPFADASVDLVLSCLSLHWVNDLPGALMQIRRVLKPDGLLLASFLGGATLTELRQAWLEAEDRIEGGVGPRVSPFADVRDAGALLQRAGFALPVVDSDMLTVTYADPLRLMMEIKAMGESNAALEQRRGFTRRATLAEAARTYRARFAGPDGRVPASFEIITMTGWRPHPTQPKPLAPGSGQVNLRDVLGRDS
jgi:NADH dehydrogenase [ubiquinone] 1 alpha subcomplex assembly factor 5